MLRLKQQYRENIFNSHYLWIYDNFLKNIPTRIPPKEAENKIVFVETRVNNLIKPLIKNTLLMTDDSIGLQIYHSPENRDYIRDIMIEFGILENVTLVNIKHDLNKTIYSKMLKSSSFWETLNCSHVLIIQLDTLMIKPLSLEYFKYDYIGAPWRSSYTHHEICGDHRVDLRFNNTDIIKSFSYNNQGVGNGGFSIRNVNLMIELSNKYDDEILKKIDPDFREYFGDSDISEDVFFSYVIGLDLQDKNNDNTSNLILPDTGTSSLLAVEHIMNKETHAVHRPWEWLNDNEFMYLLDQHLFNIIKLSS